MTPPLTPNEPAHPCVETAFRTDADGFPDLSRPYDAQFPGLSVRAYIATHVQINPKHYTILKTEIFGESRKLSFEEVVQVEAKMRSMAADAIIRELNKKEGA